MVLERALRFGFLGAAVAWTTALPIAAAIAATPHASSSAYLFAVLAYSTGRIICHQQTGRSFHLWGVQLPVCARCTGIYLGAALSSIVFASRVLLSRHANARRANARGLSATAAGVRAVVLAGCVPIALTLVFEWTTGITPSNTLRAVSGLPLGAAVAWIVVGRAGESPTVGRSDGAVRR